MIQTHKTMLKKTNIIGTKQNMRILGVIAFIKLQNDSYCLRGNPLYQAIKQHLNNTICSLIKGIFKCHFVAW